MQDDEQKEFEVEAWKKQEQFNAELMKKNAELGELARQARDRLKMSE